MLVVVVGRMIYQRLKKKRLEKKKRQLLEEKNALVDGEKPEDESNDWSGGWHAGLNGIHWITNLVRYSNIPKHIGWPNWIRN